MNLVFCFFCFFGTGEMVSEIRKESVILKIFHPSWLGFLDNLCVVENVF